MEAPSKKEVLKRFKNAKTIRCAHLPTDEGKYRVKALGQNTIGEWYVDATEDSPSLYVWDRNGGWAKILKKKKKKGKKVCHH